VHSLVAAAAALFIAPASSLNTVPRPQVPTLLYVLAQKVAIVGFSPITFANGPPRLYASTNLVNWSDVTPTGATALPKGRTTWSRFDDASFISPSTGWVATWNPGSLQEVVYGTRDAGQRWRPLFTAFHGDSAGDAYWLQLLTPELAFSQTVTANGPGQRLEVTTDGGRTWMTVYTGPHGNQGEGPFEMPTVFTTRYRGFAASGIPPAEPQGSTGYFFATNDGGTRWARESPPLPGSGKCALTLYLQQGACSFGLPVFDGPRNGVVPVVVIKKPGPVVGFDVTSDGGASWRLESQQSAAVSPSPGAYPGYGLIAVSSVRSWWVLTWTPSRLVSAVTTDGGRTWTRSAAPRPPGTPSRLVAFDGSRALLQVGAGNARAPISLFVTTDGGHNWRSPHL
jgi:photosystem II stability/assembly factor-like uncharacterized protein